MENSVRILFSTSRWAKAHSYWSALLEMAHQASSPLAYWGLASFSRSSREVDDVHQQNAAQGESAQEVQSSQPFPRFDRPGNQFRIRDYLANRSFW